MRNRSIWVACCIILALLTYHFMKIDSIKQSIEADKGRLTLLKDSIRFYKLRSIGDSLLIFGDIATAQTYYNEADEIFNMDKDHKRKLEAIAKNKVKDEQYSQLQNTLQRTKKEIQDQEQMLRSQALKKDSLFDVAKSDLEQLKDKVSQMRDSLNLAKLKIESIADAYGKCEFTSTKGVKVYYAGEVMNGKAHGKGFGLFDSGGVYEGEWKNNLRHGKGKYTWKDGNIYEGDYYGDKRQGTGTYYFISGEKYIGDWMDNKRNGKGTLYDKDGKVIVSGVWENDEIKTS